MVRRVTVRSPFQRAVGDPGARRTGECVGDRASKLIHVVVGSISGTGIEPGHAQPPAGGIARIAPQVREQCVARQGVRIALSAGEAAAAAGLRSQLDEVIRRREPPDLRTDRKSTRLNSSHGYISYAVFCLKKKKKSDRTRMRQTPRERRGRVRTSARA